MTLMQQIRTWCCTTVEGWSRWWSGQCSTLQRAPKYYLEISTPLLTSTCRHKDMVAVW